MQRVKERIHYWCEDTASGRCLGGKITVAVLDSGQKILFPYDNRKGIFMQRVKERIHYWCEDTASGRCLGGKITVAVLDSGVAFHPDFEGRILDFEFSGYDSGKSGGI